ncbi:MAG: hypothetical protein R3F62_11870 [Planctomycetota bacterium]
MRGVVLGADGVPRAGAQVWLTVPSRRRRPTRLELSTDALGRFQGEVRPGQL